VEGGGGDDVCQDWFAVHLHAQCQEAQVTRFGANALRNFLLNGQYNAPRPTRGVAFQQVPDDRRGDVVGDVRHHQVIRLIHDLCHGGLENIPMHHTHIGIWLEYRPQRSQHALIQFDRRHLSGTNSQIAGQTSQARTDLKHTVIRPDLRGKGDIFQRCGIL